MKTNYQLSADCILQFYKKQGDNKYSFLIVDEPDLTEWLLSKCKTHRVNERNIRYCVAGVDMILRPLFESISIGENAKNETDDRLEFAFNVLFDYQHALFAEVRDELDCRMLGFSKRIH